MSIDARVTGVAKLLPSAVTLGGCIESTVSLALWELGFCPPLLLGKFWGFSREPGPPFRNKYQVSDGAFHIFPGGPPRDALARHGIRLSLCRGMSRADSWARITANLHERRSTPVMLDNYHLPFYNTFHNRHHALHTYSVVGLGEQGDVVEILDLRHHAIKRYQLPCELFMQAWATDLFPWYSIDCAAQRPYTVADLASDLDQNLGGLLPAHPGEYWSTGIPAVRTFAAELGGYPDKFEANTLRAICEDGFHQVPPIRNQRFLHSIALGLAGRQLGNRLVVDLGQQLREIARGWNAIRTRFARAAKPESTTADVNRIIEKIRFVADLEEQGAERLREVIDSLEQSVDTPIGVSRDECDHMEGLAR